MNQRTNERTDGQIEQIRKIYLFQKLVKIRKKFGKILGKILRTMAEILCRCTQQVKIDVTKVCMFLEISHYSKAQLIQVSPLVRASQLTFQTESSQKGKLVSANTEVWCICRCANSISESSLGNTLELEVILT